MIVKSAPRLQGVFDGCNLFQKSDFSGRMKYAGLGRGLETPPDAFVDFVQSGFRIMERGAANEVAALVSFMNDRFVHDRFNKVDFNEVQRMARTCVTGCQIVDPGPIEDLPTYNGFVPRLVKCAQKAWEEHQA